MTRALLMTRQDNLEVFLLVEHVENLQNDPAGKRENGLHTLPLEAFDEDLSTGEFHDGTSLHTASEN
jgi:hypothetical protein